MNVALIIHHNLIVICVGGARSVKDGEIGFHRIPSESLTDTDNEYARQQRGCVALCERGRACPHRLQGYGTLLLVRCYNFVVPSQYW